MRQYAGRVDQFVERVDQHHVLRTHERLHHRVVSCERTRVRFRGFAPPLTAAEVQEHDRLSARTCRRRLPEKLGRSAYGLRQHHDDARSIVFDEERQVVFQPEHRLVAGGDGIAEAQAFRRGRKPQHAAHAAGLGEDVDSQIRLDRKRRACVHERDLDVVHQIRVPEAVRARERDIVGARDLGQPALSCSPLAAQLGKTRGEAHDAAHVLFRERLDRLHDRGAAHGQHHEVDALRQFAHLSDGGTTVDAARAAADNVDRPRVIHAVQGRDDVASRSQRLFRNADDRHRPGTQQPGDLRARDWPLPNPAAIRGSCRGHERRDERAARTSTSDHSRSFPFV